MVARGKVKDCVTARVWKPRSRPPKTTDKEADSWTKTIVEGHVARSDWW